MESRTRSLIQSAVSLGAVLVLAGCDDFLGLGDDVDVDVIAEANVDQNIISFTVVNRGPDTINYHGADLELRDDRWLSIATDRSGRVRLRTRVSNRVGTRSLRLFSPPGERSAE